MFSDPAKALHNLSVSVLTVGIFLAFIRFIETVAETMDLFWPALVVSKHSILHTIVPSEHFTPKWPKSTNLW